MKQIYYVIQTLLRGRGSNIIKVISLGLGLTMSILLFSRVAYEQSFDTCFKDYDNLYQVWSIFSVKGEKFEPQEWNCGPVAGAILENFPKEVESAVSLSTSMVSAPLYNGSVRLDDRKIAADSLFFRTMGIDVLNGNPEKDLVQKDIIFLSERFARKVFGEENPIGKTLNYDHQFDLTVKGIYANLPENATINPEAVISMPTLWSRNWNNYSWSGGDSWVEFIRFRPGADKSVVNARIDAMIDKYRPAEDKKEYGYTAFVQPIRDTYRNYDDVQRMRVIMSILGFAILFIAALNYVLISISSLSYRAKSVGVHKCSGASGGTVFSMFLLETGIIIVAALLLMALIMLNFRDFVEDTVVVKLSTLLAPERIWVPLSVVLLLFIVGGVLPGRLFARIPVSQVFRRYTEGKKGWKRPLLFVQFAGVAFISGLMCVVMSQYQYVLKKDMGYNPKQIAIGNAYWDNEATRDAAYQFFKGLPYVEAVSSAQQRLLAAILREPRYLELAKQQLTAEQFIQPQQKELYEAMLNCSREGVELSLTALRAFASEEALNELSRLAAQYSDVNCTPEDIHLYLDRIARGMPVASKAAAMSGDEITQYLQSMREKKQGTLPEQD